MSLHLNVCGSLNINTFKKKTVVIFIHLNVLDEHKTMKTDFVIAIQSVKLKKKKIKQTNKKHYK